MPSIQTGHPNYLFGGINKTQLSNLFVGESKPDVNVFMTWTDSGQTKKYCLLKTTTKNSGVVNLEELPNAPASTYIQSSTYIPQMGMYFIGCTGSKVYVSSDCVNWEIITIDSSASVRIDQFKYVDAWSKLFAICYDGSIYSTTDGTTWVKVNSKVGSGLMKYACVTNGSSSESIRLIACVTSKGTVYSDDGDTFDLAAFSGTVGSYNGTGTVVEYRDKKCITVANNKVYSLGTYPVSWNSYNNKTLSTTPYGFGQQTNDRLTPVFAHYFEDLDIVIGIAYRLSSIMDVSVITNDFGTVTSKMLSVGNLPASYNDGCYDEKRHLMYLPAVGGVYVVVPQLLHDVVTDTKTIDDLKATYIAIPELDGMTMSNVRVSVCE